MLAFDRAFDPPRMLDTALPGLECTLGMAAGDGHGPSLGRLQEAQKQGDRAAGRAFVQSLRHSRFKYYHLQTDPQILITMSTSDGKLAVISDKLLAVLFKEQVPAHIADYADSDNNEDQLLSGAGHADISTLRIEHRGVCQRFCFGCCLCCIPFHSSSRKETALRRGQGGTW